MSRQSATLCQKEHIEPLMKFMAEKWSSTQLLSTNRSAVDYFFYDKNQQRYNIIISQNTETKEITGFIAFTRTAFFDEKIAAKDDFIWITNWFTAKEAEGGSGIFLYMKLRSLFKGSSFGTVGQNPEAEAIYTRLKYATGELNQYFIVNEKAANKNGGFKIVENYMPKQTVSAIRQPTEPPHGFMEIGEDEIRKIEPLNTQRPPKSASYIIGKYLKSPYYNYFAYGVSNNCCLRGAIIFKEIKHNGGTILSAAEYFGDINALADKSGHFQALLSQFSAECIYFYCAGIPERILKSSGFNINSGQNGLIIPNYYEPFLRDNISIRYAYDINDKSAGFTVYKGDCDREYPRS